MAPKADPKKKKEESSSEEEESYEYETESSSEKPAAKKADDKKPAADAKKDAAKPAAAAAKKPESSEEESDESEYETESESSEKKKDDKKAPAATATVTVKTDDKSKGTVTATATVKTDDKKKDAMKKKDESEDDEDEEDYEYEYESEYETESGEKKPGAKAGDKKPVAATAAAAKTDNKSAAAAPATKTVAATTTTTKTTTTATTAAPLDAGMTGAGMQREVVMAAAPAGPMTAKDWAGKFFAELIGTFILCYVIFQFRLQYDVYGRLQVDTNGNIVGATGYVSDPIGGVVSHALVQAFAVGAVTAAFGYICQAQFNPAVTLAMVILRQTPILTGLIFIVLQFAGAILAGLLAWGLAPPLTQWQPNGNVGPGYGNSTQLHQVTYGTGFAAPYSCAFWSNGSGSSGSITPTTDLNPQCWREGFGAEIVGSFIFIMVYLMCFVAGHGGDLAWFAVAAALAVCVFAFHTTSNAFFNPARAIGGAVFTFGYVWTNFWVYIIGPLIGSVMAIIVFGLIFQNKADKSKGENLFRHN